MSTTKKARERAQVILQVRTGKLTATEGARLLGVSRKTYYEWESRGLAAMMQELEDRETGRPAQEVDPKKEQQEAQIARLSARVKELEAVADIRAVMMKMDAARGSKKKH
jgi:transposase